MEAHIKITSTVDKWKSKGCLEMAVLVRENNNIEVINLATKPFHVCRIMYNAFGDIPAVLRIIKTEDGLRWVLKSKDGKKSFNWVPHKLIVKSHKARVYLESFLGFDVTSEDAMDEYITHIFKCMRKDMQRHARALQDNV